MKQLITIILTFAFAFATTIMLDMPFISGNVIRYVLVVFLILIEFFIGFQIIKQLSNK